MWLREAMQLRGLPEYDGNVTQLAEVRILPWPDSLATWSLAARILPLYWKAGKKLDAVASRKWRQELGTIVQGMKKDPHWLLDFIVSADQALEALRRRSAKAYLLSVHSIEHPMHEWFNERGTGAAQVIGFHSEDQAYSAFAGAQMYLHWMLEMDEQEEPEDIGRALGP